MFRAIQTPAGANWKCAAALALVMGVPGLSAAQVVGDFNGDAKVDILWQQPSTGVRGFWPMNGTALAGDLVTITQTAPDWEIAGMADFNADQNTDLLWRNSTTGAVGIWLMNGTVQQGPFISLRTMPVYYEVAGVGDFNFDGKADIVWQDPRSGAGGGTVTREVWYLGGNGTTNTGTFSALAAAATVGSDWVISLVADFDSDGKPDLFWTNTATGQRGLWMMNGLLHQSGFTSLGIVPADWTATQSGDFNSDGRLDIVWTNTTTGERRIWLLGAFFSPQSVSLPTIPMDWRLGPIGSAGLPFPVVTSISPGRIAVVGTNVSLTVAATTATAGTLTYQWERDGIAIPGATSTSLDLAAVSLADNATYGAKITLNGLASSTRHTIVRVVTKPTDFDFDGNSDVLWQNLTTGQRGYWPMNGTTTTNGSYVSFTGVPGEWVIAGTADFNWDGKTDFLWRNRATNGSHVGMVGIWLMNGTTQISAFQIVGSAMAPAWNIAGIADMNGDLHYDVVWQNSTTGERVIWNLYMSNYTHTSSLGTLPTSWVISQVADFNGDEKADLLWTDTQTGLRGFWLMNNSLQHGTFTPFAVVPTEWVLASAQDFNGDGKTDLLWSNTITGQRGFWLMDGINLASQFIPLANISTDWSLGPIK